MHKTLDRRKLKDIRVMFISLVARPATGKALALKGEAFAVQFEIRKTDEELKRAYGIVYAPEQTDAQGDWTDAAEIRKAADEWMAGGRAKNVDQGHSFKKENAFVAESWLVRKGDPLFPDEPEGAWAVGIQVTDEGLWANLKKGDLTGISLAGWARSEPARKQEEEPPGWFTRFFKKDKGENPMEKELLDAVKALGDKVEALAKSIEGDGGAGDAPEAVTLDQVQQVVKEAVDAARAETNTELTKMLAEALAKGRQATGGGDKSTIESEMV